MLLQFSLPLYFEVSLSIRFSHSSHRMSFKEVLPWPWLLWLSLLSFFAKHYMTTIHFLLNPLSFTTSLLLNGISLKRQVSYLPHSTWWIYRDICYSHVSSICLETPSFLGVWSFFPDNLVAHCFSFPASFPLSDVNVTVFQSFIFDFLHVLPN